HGGFARDIGSSCNRIAAGTGVEYAIRVPLDNHHTLRFGTLHTINDIESLTKCEDGIAFQGEEVVFRVEVCCDNRRRDDQIGWPLVNPVRWIRERRRCWWLQVGRKNATCYPPEIGELPTRLSIIARSCT